MLRYLLLRIMTALLVVLGVTTIVFFLLHVVPGDPVEVMLGETVHAADRESLRIALGLDQPIWVQWWRYLNNLLHLDLGTSIHSHRAIADLLSERIPVTAYMACSALMVAMLIAFPLGVVAALRRNSVIDHGAMVFAMLGVSIPNFWLGPVLILVFSYWAGLFPVSGMQGVGSVVLPAFTLGTALAALQSRMLRAALLEILNEDYIRAARARGIKEVSVIIHHAVRNALLPVITVLGVQLGALLTGSVVTEYIFDWPGVGQLLIDAIQKRDYPVVQACVLLISVTYVVVNLLTDMVYSWLDPRIRLEQ
ncbi:MAG: nickel ABC transporter permease [Gammaproteobacteria bacterium]